MVLCKSVFTQYVHVVSYRYFGVWKGVGRGLLGQKVARNVFSWHPFEKHLVYGLFERHIGTLQPKKVLKPKTCPIPRKQPICRYLILNCITARKCEILH